MNDPQKLLELIERLRSGEDRNAVLQELLTAQAEGRDGIEDAQLIDDRAALRAKNAELRRRLRITQRQNERLLERLARLRERLRRIYRVRN